VGPAAAPGRAPEAAIDGVGSGFGRDGKAEPLEVGDRLLALDAEIADRRDDFEIGGQHAEGDVEANLVVAGAGGAVGHGARADFAGGGDDTERLLRPLGGDAQRVDLAPEHVALHEEADEPVEDLLARVYFMVVDRADGVRLAADGGPLLGTGAVGVDEHRVHGPAILGEPGHAVRSIESARKGERQHAA
jgi:hypothetical protein